MAAEELAQATGRSGDGGAAQQRPKHRLDGRREGRPAHVCTKMRERLSRAVCLLAILGGRCGVPGPSEASP
eukprot:3111651-Prymnesium_polylepis.1